jgi:hypothetical protein
MSPPPVKQEAFDMQAMIASMVSEFIRQTGGTSGGLPAPATARGPNPNKPLRCLFCSDPNCWINACKKVEEYITQGKCARGPTGRVVLPNGEQLPRGLRGRNLAEKFDAYHASNPLITTAIIDTVLLCAMIEEIFEVARKEEDDEKEEEPDDYVRVMANELRREKGKTKVEVVMP